jgi:hypothetical protein
MGYTETFGGRSAIGFFPDPIAGQPRTLEQQVTNRPKTYPQTTSQSRQLFLTFQKQMMSKLQSQKPVLLSRFEKGGFWPSFSVKVAFWMQKPVVNSLTMD